MIAKAFKKSIFYILLTIGAFIMLIPFLWLLSNAFKTPENILRIPPQFIPRPFTVENFKVVWEKLSFLQYTLNSFLIVSLDILGVVLSASLVGFGFAMFEFRGKKILFTLMLATMMMPSQVTMIPNYFIWSKLGLLTLNSSPEADANMGIRMAGAVITMAPVIIIFLFAQRYFVEGIASTGIKG
ncbi:MAG: carbohydrate ABC transporter permease [Epulopiscium sp.]|nr:carbohydrate ABC transporter permease [Candidatus Epulonipiscium sp.]